MLRFKEETQSPIFSSSTTLRQRNWQLAEGNEFDVVIIGGGINGTTVYNRLCSQGYKVFLLDKGDFSCGTSQASAMMIWGGLLYLKNLDFFSVYHFSKDRDDLIETHGQEVDPMYFRYILNCEWGRNKYLVSLALYLYWILGKFRRQKPSFQKTYDELKFLSQKRTDGSFIYQEGVLKDSDSRFVLDWLFSHQTETSFAMNYCALEHADYSVKEKKWVMAISDTLTNKQCSIKAKLILNCSGVWADTVNRKFGIQTPYRHVLSKGVFISFKRPEEHHTPLIFEMGKHGDTLTFIPWGPISLWGPTETMENSIEDGFAITPRDIHFLQYHASRNLDPSLVDSRIISLRCGIRPLAVEKEFKADCYPLEISRYHRIASDPLLPWISVYGGKISGCVSMAEEVARKVEKHVQPSELDRTPQAGRKSQIDLDYFPGLQEKFPSLEWCVQNEFCCSLEDYLRRRTNISQWIPREGLGFQNENREHILKLARQLPAFEGKTPEAHMAEYVTRVKERFDGLLEQI